ncbi:hypothetical protein [Streptomyces sp. NPDC048349]|uniref:hypothetical protein n=1 Tax=Streptomyces sp. NPDC048349 TaxID=3155486 RepID=UPI003432B377
MTERRRVAAVIIRDGCVLMVSERHRGPCFRGDVAPGESVMVPTLPSNCLAEPGPGA